MAESQAHIWAHRGGKGPGKPPENSLAAFERSLAEGAHGIELDVFAALDGRLVVFHDDNLERLTNGVGDIRTKDSHYLNTLRLKEYADQGGAKVPENRLCAQTIPTLDAVMELVQKWRAKAILSRNGAERKHAANFVVNIEIKGPGIAGMAAAAIDRYISQGWKPENFQVSSFDLESLREMRKANPRIPIGALFEGAAAPWDVTPQQVRDFLGRIKDIKPETVNLTYPSLTPEVLRMLRVARAQPVAWTSGERNPAQLPLAERTSMAARLRRGGITLITDYPREMLELLEAERQKPGRKI